MIEKTTIAGRPATVAYTDDSNQPTTDLSKPHFAHVMFDDKPEMILLHSKGHTEEHDAAGWSKHRRRTGGAQHAARTEQARKVRAWQDAINILDGTEAQIRDVIERGLARVAGLDGMKYNEAMAAVDAVVEKVSAIRTRAIKRAFRHIRDKGV